MGKWGGSVLRNLWPHFAAVAAFFVQMSVWPHHSADFCECPLCSSFYFEGTHCHKDSALALSNGFELIGRCRKCELGVPFTCGHNSCLSRQI